MTDRDIEARLRDAIRARTEGIDPMTDDQTSLDAIEQRVAAARRTVLRRRIGLSVVGVAAAAAVVVGLVALVGGDDDQRVVTDPASDSTTTTTVQGTTTTTTAPPAAAPVKAVWPFEASGVKFATPGEAALSFAQEYLGMTNAVVDPAQTGDVTIVDVRPRPTAGAKTHVELIEQDGGWVVLGAKADSIQVATPAAGDALTDPLHVAGQSTAFEAQINLQMRPFGSIEKVGDDSFTMGGANGEMGPFETDIDVADGLTEGVLVVYEGDASGEGDMTAATVIRLGVPARGAVAAPAPDRIYAWKQAKLLELDDQGEQFREVSGTASPVPTGLAVGGGKIATTDRDFTEGGCGRGITMHPSGELIRGEHPAFSTAGQLAYVNCDTEVVANGAAYDTTPNTVVGLSWVGDKVIAAFEGGAFTVLTQQGSWNGTLPTGRGRYGTIAFLDADGTIASVDPASPSRAPVPLVTPAAKPVSLDADDSGAHLLWTDTNGDLWKWSGGDPVKLGTGFTTAAW